MTLRNKAYSKPTHKLCLTCWINFSQVGQSLLQTVERITKCVNFVTKRGKHNYKVGQLRFITKGQKILKSGTVNPSQYKAIIITQRSKYYKKGHFITKWDRYYKLGQELLQSGAGNSLQSGSIIVVKCGRYY